MDKVLLIPYIIQRMKELGIKDYVLRPRYIEIQYDGSIDTFTFQLEKSILYPVMISPFTMECKNGDITDIKLQDSINLQQFRNTGSPSPDSFFQLVKSINLNEYTNQLNITLQSSGVVIPANITIPFVEVIPNLIQYLENE